MRTLILVTMLLVGNPALAEMKWTDGLQTVLLEPKPHVSDVSVMLKVPHKRQLPGLCVPTSAAMILSYFGESADPVELKNAAESGKASWQRNSDFTLWSDMKSGLEELGHSGWRIRNYSKDDAGFAKGLDDIRNSLRNDLPVMIDVHLDEGHTFVIMGFDDQARTVFIRDPNIDGLNFRKISYSQLERDWHNHRFGKSRSAFFSAK